MYPEDLRKMMGMLQPDVQIHLERIRLQSGTWAEALDCIRSKACLGSRVKRRFFGAEAETMPDQDFERLFRFNPEPYGNLASQYIQSIDGVTNPLHEDVGEDVQVVNLEH
jgi:hypothetical protein